MPDGIGAPCVGARVVVPLGARVVTGIVVQTNVDRRTPNDEPTPNAERRHKPVREILDQTAFVPADVVALAQWTAEYLRGRSWRHDPRAVAADGAWRSRGCAQDDSCGIDHRGGIDALELEPASNSPQT